MDGWLGIKESFGIVCEIKRNHICFWLLFSFLAYGSGIVCESWWCYIRVSCLRYWLNYYTSFSSFLFPLVSPRVCFQARILTSLASSYNTYPFLETSCARKFWWCLKQLVFLICRVVVASKANGWKREGRTIFCCSYLTNAVFIFLRGRIMVSGRLWLWLWLWWCLSNFIESMILCTDLCWFYEYGD